MQLVIPRLQKHLKVVEVQAREPAKDWIGRVEEPGQARLVLLRRREMDIEVDALDARLRPLLKIGPVRRDHDLRRHALRRPPALPMGLDDVLERRPLRWVHVVEDEWKAGVMEGRTLDATFGELGTGQRLEVLTG